MASVTFTEPLDLASPSTPRSQTQPYSHPAIRRRAFATPKAVTKLASTPTVAVGLKRDEKVGVQAKVLSVKLDVPSKVLKIRPMVVPNPSVLKIVPKVDTNAKLLRQPRLVRPVVSSTVKPAVVPARVSDPMADALNLGVRAIELNNVGRLDESASLLRQAIALAPDAVSAWGGHELLNRSLAALGGRQAQGHWCLGIHPRVHRLSLSALAQLPQRLRRCAEEPMEAPRGARSLSRSHPTAPRLRHRVPKPRSVPGSPIVQSGTYKRQVYEMTVVATANFPFNAWPPS